MIQTIIAFTLLSTLSLPLLQLELQALSLTHQSFDETIQLLAS